MSFKRPRTPTARSTSSSPSPSSPLLEPTPKSSRKNPSSSSRRALQCSLPPTCNPPHNHPTHIANTRDLESHYAIYHAHVCESQGCGCVFPEARLLELHQTECHDPLAALRKERGEKIFACHLASCTRLFSSPKTRRLHLIDSHAYPKEYFFAVTNKGIGGLLTKWGEGATMLRGGWKERNGNEKEDAEEHTEDLMHEDGAQTVPSPPYATRTQTKSDTAQARTDTAGNADEHLDGLISSMTSLTLVPPSIRFGRGGRSGGFGTATGARAGTGTVNGHTETQIATNSHPVTSPNVVRARGRGRGRGIVHHHPSTNGNPTVPGQVQVTAGRGGKTRGVSGKADTDTIPAHVGANHSPRGAARGGRGGIVHVAPGRGRGGVRGVPRGRGRGGPF